MKKSLETRGGGCRGRLPPSCRKAKCAAAVPVLLATRSSECRCIFLWTSLSFGSLRQRWRASHPKNRDTDGNPQLQMSQGYGAVKDCIHTWERGPLLASWSRLLSSDDWEVRLCALECLTALGLTRLVHSAQLGFAVHACLSAGSAMPGRRARENTDKAGAIVSN